MLLWGVCAQPAAGCVGMPCQTAAPWVPRGAPTGETAYRGSAVRPLGRARLPRSSTQPAISHATELQLAVYTSGRVALGRWAAGPSLCHRPDQVRSAAQIRL